VGGEVKEFRTTENQDYVVMDPTNAYPKKELKKWRRHVILDKPDVTVVLDEIHTNSGANIEVRFHPGVDYAVEDGFVMLTGEKGKMALISLTDLDYETKPGRHASQFVNGTKEFDWVPYFDVEVRSKSSKTMIGTIILPVENVEEAKQIVESKKLTTSSDGGVTIEFSRRGENFSFQYNNFGEELLLKN
ncbi:MAG: heparinase II/III-family protein, partial [Cyclobacteriaceae bacterium]|nr:heparinase II/III-family protein [Cyclobacteriaceae bacterium]